MAIKNWIFYFYGNPLQDSYKGRTVVSPALIDCTQESLALAYKHCKEYMIIRRNDLSVELLAKENINRKLDCLKVDATKIKMNIKIAEQVLMGIPNKQKESLSTKEFLNETVVSSAFPTICYLLKLFILVPIS